MAYLIVVPLFALLGLGLVAMFVAPGVGTVMLAVFILVTLGLFGAAVRWTTRRRRRVRPTPSQ